MEFSYVFMISGSSHQGGFAAFAGCRCRCRLHHCAAAASVISALRFFSEKFVRNSRNEHVKDHKTNSLVRPPSPTNIVFRPPIIALFLFAFQRHMMQLRVMLRCPFRSFPLPAAPIVPAQSIFLCNQRCVQAPYSAVDSVSFL